MIPLLFPHCVTQFLMQAMEHVEPQKSAACQSLWPQPHRQADLRNLTKEQKITEIKFESETDELVRPEMKEYHRKPSSRLWPHMS